MWTAAAFLGMALHDSRRAAVSPGFAGFMAGIIPATAWRATVVCPAGRLYWIVSCWSRIGTDGMAITSATTL
jgi:hypothetical protein